MVVALRPETGVADHTDIFQSLDEEHQKNVARWALANRARVSDEARVALNNALVGHVSVRGFRESDVPDAPAIMLIQPVRNAALVVDAIAESVLTVWRESRVELRGIVEAAVDDVAESGGSTFGAPGENLSTTLASAHPQYSSGDVNLMIALTLHESLQEIEDEPDIEEEHEEEVEAAPQALAVDLPQDDRSHLRDKIALAMQALEEAAALIEAESIIEEIIPSGEEGPADETSADEAPAHDHAAVEPVDAADEAEKQYLREMVEALQSENIQLKAAAQPEKTDFHALILEHEETREARPDSTAAAVIEEHAPEIEEAFAPPVADAVEEEIVAPPVAEVVEAVEESVEAEEPVAPPAAEIEESAPETAETLAAPPDFGDVASVLDFVENRWPDELRLALNGGSEHKMYFDQPNQVYSALEWLATTYRNSRTGEKPVGNLDVSLFTTCGWRYRPLQPDGSLGRHRSDYQTSDDGKTYTLEEHIGRGTGRTPGQIRVAFTWDDERKVVVVGYVGRQQRASAI